MLLAVEYVRRMRGGAQAQLLRCNDNRYYVVKFPNNPQGGVRILVNELLGFRLAQLMGLPIQEGEIIRVPEILIRGSEEMLIELRHLNVPCQSGLCFGSRYPGYPKPVQAYDALPESYLNKVSNLTAFAGMLVFDQWTCNTDGRQVIFVEESTGHFRASMIDQGLCFNGSEWTFPDSSLRGIYRQQAVYESVDEADFEYWTDRMERLEAETIISVGERIPCEWCSLDKDHLNRLLEKLVARKKRIRELLYLTHKAAPLILAGTARRTDAADQPSHQIASLHASGHAI
jgi:hypothetical protein